jgi:hypothetical protein
LILVLFKVKFKVETYVYLPPSTLHVMSRLFVIAAGVAVMAALVGAQAEKCGQYCGDTRQCGAGCSVL